MAIVPVTYTDANRVGSVVNDAILPAWDLAAGDVGAPAKLGAFADRTVQFSGSFAGSSMALRGSNFENPDPEDDAQWFFISDPKLTTPISNIVAPAGFVLYENPLWISPKCTGGTATAIKTIILGRKK